MIETKDITRPSPEICAALAEIGTAGCTGALNNVGIPNSFIKGPRGWNTGEISIAGPALTLQFMPKRQDLYGEGEYDDPEKQLHRHVLYHTKPGDFVVVDARSDMTAGIFGEMMMTYFKGRGGIGMVIDGCVRDYAHVKNVGVPLWMLGVTPNFHTQTGLMPFAVNGPVACGGVLVMPGDIIVADEDGSCCVPAALAEHVVKSESKHKEWEDFARIKLSEGGDLRKYYPLRADARVEYDAWRAAKSAK
ncbi:MAG: ribonuclease activity regulator RraA [bacterium]